MTNQVSKQEQLESALRLLELQGFEVKPLWRELSERIAKEDRGEPSEDDRRYELPVECPRTESHLAGGNEELAPARLWNGLSYSLSSGMRGLLRDQYGLTPTMTVTVKWVEPWPGTRFPRRMLLASDVHVDPRNRKHVLTECVISRVGEFFRLARERDEAVVEEVKSDCVEEAISVGRIIKLTSEDRWAFEDLSGVKVGVKVEVVHTNAERFTVVCLHSGNKTTVTKEEFFATVKEYERLYETEKRGKGRGKFEVTPALDALIEGLSK